MRRGWILLAVVLGSAIVFLDGTVVNVALPKIGTELPHTFIGVLEGQTYVNSGYLAVLSALLILAGALSDYYGRRRMFALGLVGFGVTSVLCGLAPNLELLVVFRLLQGASGALLVPGALSIITANFQGAERGRAFGVWAAASAATTTLGPILGGLLVDTISWRLAFLINAPLVVLALYATLRHVPESRDEEATGRFDWLGAAVIAIGVGGLAFGATRGQESGWSDPFAFAVIAVGALATIAFPFLMAMRPNPLVPLDLFRSRNFTVTNLSTFVVYGALYISLSFQGLFLQGTLGYTATAAGASGLPVGIALALFSPRVGALAGRYGGRWFLTAGPALMGLGMLWLARLPATSEPWRANIAEPATIVPSSGYLIDVLPAMIVFAAGLTLLVSPLTTAIMASVPVRRAGIASAINNAVSRVGAPLVGALIFIAITATFYSNLSSRAPTLDVSDPQVRQDIQPLNPPKRELTPDEARALRETSTDAFHLAVLVAAGLLFAGAAINGLGIRDQPAEGSAAAAEAAPGPA